MIASECGEHLTRRTAYWWPRSVDSGTVGLRTSHSLTDLSTEPVAKIQSLYLFQSVARISYACAACPPVGRRPQPAAVECDKLDSPGMTCGVSFGATVSTWVSPHPGSHRLITFGMCIEYAGIAYCPGNWRNAGISTMVLHRSGNMHLRTMVSVELGWRKSQIFTVLSPDADANTSAWAAGARAPVRRGCISADGAQKQRAFRFDSSHTLRDGVTMTLSGRRQDLGGTRPWTGAVPWSSPACAGFHATV
jgi:hypothetical protein